MVPILFLFICLTKSQEPDGLITSNLNVVETNCLDDYLPLCQFCNSSKSLLLPHHQDFQIEGQYQSTIDLLTESYASIRQFLPAENYSLSLSGNGYCFMADRINQQNNLSGLLQENLQIASIQVQHPEIFQIDSQLVSAFIQILPGAGQSYYIQRVDAAFNAPGQAVMADRVTLNLQQFTLQAQYMQLMIEYQGKAVLGDRQQTALFTISTRNGRNAFENFSVEISADRKQNLGQWANYISQRSQCSEIRNPRGFESVEYLQVSHTLLNLQLNQNTQTMQVVNSYSFVEVPSFSIAPNILFQQISGILRIDHIERQCTMVMSGFWTGDYQMRFNLHLDKSDRYFMTTWIGVDPRELTIADIQTSFLESQYIDFQSIFPDYKDEDSGFLERLQQSVVKNPHFTYFFNPQMSISVIGDLDVYQSSLASFQLYTSRVNHRVETFVRIANLDQKALGQMVAEGLEESGFFLQNGLIISSTGTFESQSHFSMRMQGFQNNVQAGIFVEADVIPSCQDNELCQLLTNMMLFDTNYRLVGQYYPTQFVLETQIDGIPIQNALVFQNAHLKLYIQPADMMRYEGTFYLKGSQAQDLEFFGWIYQLSNDAYIEGRLVDTWNQAFDITNFNIYNLQLTGDVNNDGLMKSISLKGWGAFTCNDEICWRGTINAQLSPNNHTNNYFTGNFQSADTESILSAFRIEQRNGLTSSLEFNSGMIVHFGYQETFTYQKGFTISGYLQFMGVSSQFEAFTDNFSRNLVLSIEMPDIIANQGNVQFLRGTEDTIKGSLDILNNQGLINTEIRTFGIEQQTQLVIQNDQLQFAIEGNLFDGSYKAYISARAELQENLKDLNWSFQIQLDQQLLDELTSRITNKLQDWIESGYASLTYPSLLIEQLQQKVEDSANQNCENPCPLIQSCSTDPIKVCEVFAQSLQCGQQRQGCSEIQNTCTYEELVCVYEEKLCLERDENNKCIDYEQICKDDIEVCTNWESQCLNEIQGGCQNYTLIQEDDECLRWGTDCETIEIEDPACAVQCDYHQALAQEYQQQISELEEQQEVVLDLFGGFVEIYGITENSDNLFNISNSLAEVNSDQIDPNQLEFEFIVLIPDLSIGGYRETTVQVKWDSYNQELNNKRLFQAILQKVVQLSDGKLDENLVLRKPTEILQEQLNRPINIS